MALDYGLSALDSTWACRSMGGCLPCKQAIRVRFPVGPLGIFDFGFAIFVWGNNQIENPKSEIKIEIGPVVQWRRRLNDIQEIDGSSPSGITVRF